LIKRESICIALSNAMPRGGTFTSTISNLTPSQSTALLTRMGTNGAVSDASGSQASQLRTIAEALVRPPFISSSTFSLSDDSVIGLPDIPVTAVCAEIQFQLGDETVNRVARSTINGTPPTETLGFFEYNDAFTIIYARAEVLAYRTRRLDGLGTLNVRIAYYG
jgi:hypothetical protein